MSDQRYIVVVSGPSGAGKSTVVEVLCNKYADVEVAVSATTRPPRKGEEDGIAYHFISKKEFERRIEAGDFVEYTRYVDNYYGTLHSEVQKRVEKKITCVLEIETDGAHQVKEQFPDCITVFVLAPSDEELERRLRGRGSETEQSLRKRLAKARQELELAAGYAYQVTNHAPEECADEIYALIKARQGG